MKRFCKIINALLACALPLASLTQPAYADTKTLLGVFYGQQGWQMSKVQALENWQGKKNAVLNMFTSWCNETTSMDNLFKYQLRNIWNNQNVPMLSWEPYLCSPSSTPNDVEVRAANGEYDAYFSNWADRLKTFLSGPDGVYGTSDDRRVYIRLGHEMNGDWYPWGAAMGNNSPSDYVNMWKHVKNILDSKKLDANHVQWVWCVINVDIGGYSAESFYPGDDYVNWIGIDGYNWGNSLSPSSWKTPEQVFGSMIRRMRAMTNKPITIPEVGSTTYTTSGNNTEAKLQWIDDALKYIVAQNIKMIVWFNEDIDTDWAVFGGTRGNGTFTYNGKTYINYSSYKALVESSNFVSSSSTKARLLTDEQFAGY